MLFRSIVTNSFSAEYGRTGGGVILASIKAGGNALHGTVFEFLRNEKFNARNFFAQPTDAKPVLKRNQFGAAAGGPIRRDRAFFFVNWQATRERTAATRTSSVPTPAMRSGDFSQGFNPIYDPDTTRRDAAGRLIRDQFQGNSIPRARWDAAAAKALEFYPLPNGPGLANNYTLSGPDRKSTRLNSSHIQKSRMPSSA